MKKIIFIISFIALFHACQMFVLTNEQEEFTEIISAIDNSLLGVWENSMDNSDSPPSICALEFENNFDFKFYPALGFGNNKYQRGTYKIVDDTLFLQFYKKKYIEKYIYKISESKLNIKPVFNQYSQYSLAHFRENKIYNIIDNLNSYFEVYIEQ